MQNLRLPKGKALIDSDGSFRFISSSGAPMNYKITLASFQNQNFAVVNFNMECLSQDTIVSHLTDFHQIKNLILIPKNAKNHWWYSNGVCLKKILRPNKDIEINIKRFWVYLKTEGKL